MYALSASLAGLVLGFVGVLQLRRALRGEGLAWLACAGAALLAGVAAASGASVLLVPAALALPLAALGLAGTPYGTRRWRLSLDALISVSALLFACWRPLAQLGLSSTAVVSAVAVLVAAGIAFVAWSIQRQTWSVGLASALLVVFGGVVGSQWAAQVGWIALAAAALLRLSGGSAPAPRVPPHPLVAPGIPLVAAVFETIRRLADGLYFEPAIGAVGAAIVVLVLGRQFFEIFAGRAVARDLEAEVKRRTAALARSEIRFRSLVQQSSDLVTIIDADGLILFQTPAIERVLGFVPGDFDGHGIEELVHRDDIDKARAVFAAAIESPDDCPVIEWRLRRSSGEWAWCETLVRSLLGDPAVAGIVLNTRDISERRALENQLVQEALRDPLTGLGNRVLFRDRVSNALDRSARSGVVVAVMLIDLDDFKAVNDGLGHAAGDVVLATVARRLQQAVRPGDTVARLGGDEFAILSEATDLDTGTEAVTTRILELMRAPMLIAGHEVFVGASIGVARSTTSPSAGELLRDADAAMYEAKRKGKSQAAVFEPRMHQEMKDRLTVASELRRAVSAQQFTLRYQPIVSLTDSEVVGYEALVRWRHPTRGLIMPSEFIPVAEATGVIVPMGTWILEQSCDAARQLQAASTKDAPTITVNLSARQFQDPDLAGQVQSVLESSGIEPSAIVLEITESAVMADLDQALGVMRRLKDLGVRLALDDFGTGYSSLSYLRRFPIDVLKIDRSFISAMGTPQGEGVIESILRLGDTFEVRTLAEGIEEPDQLARLRSLGCDLGQGWLFGRADPLSHAIDRAKRSAPPEAAPGPGRAVVLGRSLIGGSASRA